MSTAANRMGMRGETQPLMSTVCRQLIAGQLMVYTIIASPINRVWLTFYVVVTQNSTCIFPTKGHRPEWLG